MGLEWVNRSLMYVCIPSLCLTATLPSADQGGSDDALGDSVHGDRDDALRHLVNNAVGRREFQAENRTRMRFLASNAPAPRKIALSLLSAQCFSCNLASTKQLGTVLRTANWLSNTGIAGLVNYLTHTRPNTRPKLELWVAAA